MDITAIRSFLSYQSLVFVNISWRIHFVNLAKPSNVLVGEHISFLDWVTDDCFVHIHSLVFNVRETLCFFANPFELYLQTVASRSVNFFEVISRQNPVFSRLFVIKYKFVSIALSLDYDRLSSSHWCIFPIPNDKFQWSFPNMGNPGFVINSKRPRFFVDNAPYFLFEVFSGIWVFWRLFTTQ